MKTNVFLILFVFFNALSAFCGGNFELVNSHEIGLNNITDVTISYSSEKVSVFMGTTDNLIIKEYMSENKNEYFARINKSGNIVTIENGRWPFRPFFNSFNRRLEVYLPISFDGSIKIKVSSGEIESSADIFCSKINIESSSGSISVKSITADTVGIKSSSGSINIGNIKGYISTESSSGRIEINQASGILSAKNKSGSIVFNKIEGNVSAEASSGSIDLKLVLGSVNAETTSGSIRCTIGEPTGNISLTASSGGVRLNLPRSSNFNFSSKTSSGSLSTPFSDKLFSPVNDKKSIQGVIGGNVSENIPSINIKTSSGSIKIDWT
jgi:DUF4097 and DUF4098 domain-containing protein YvlB